MQADKRKTGVFKQSGSNVIVVMWQGRKICEYPTMADFIDSHLAGIEAMEDRQEKLLADAYRDKL